MAEKKAIKEVKKNTSKKPVEQPKNNKVEPNAKKAKEVKVEPKRSERDFVEAKVEPMSNDMVEKDKDDKIWIIIALLLVLLVGGAFVANKVVNTKKVEESSNNKIYVSKVVNQNDDGTVTVKVKVKSNVGLKSITLEDGTVMNYNNKKEVEVKFTAEENKEYTLVIKDKNGVKTKKKIKVTQVKKVKQEEDQVLQVEEQVTPTYVVYYHRPENDKTAEEVVETVETISFNVENDSFTNEDVELEITANAEYDAVVKFNEEEEVPFDGEIFTEEGKYVVTVKTKKGKTETVTFTIDKTAPEFVNIVDGEEYEGKIEAYATDDNLDGYVLEFVNHEYYNASENVPLVKGTYTVVAYDKAGNNTSVTVNVKDIQTEDNNVHHAVLVYDNYAIITVSDELMNENASFTLEKLDEEGNFVEVSGFELNNAITEVGSYRFNIKYSDSEEVKSMYFEVKEKEPVVTEPEEIEPEVTNPEETDSEVTDPVVTDPVVKEPENSNKEKNNQTNTNSLAPLKDLEDEVKVDEIIK